MTIKLFLPDDDYLKAACPFCDYVGQVLVTYENEYDI